MRDPHHLTMASGAATYILNELYWEEGDDVAGFSYPLPQLRARVHNANFLGAALFCRVYKHAGERKFLNKALKIARYSANRQRDDGSWDYGELPTQRWVDNFHTGYNLCALRSIGRNAGTSEFDTHVRRGFDFYRKYFFTYDGAPKYFNDRTYPIDIHCVAQSIITLHELKDLGRGNADLAQAVYAWAMNHLWDENGYFYYQALPFYKNKISYMRWSQAWMLLALSALMGSGREDQNNLNPRASNAGGTAGEVVRP
jgi:mannose/cellobiose epimerase-like protein (N-acyl-D-glucosamine 2-epimerase family)